MTRTVRFVVRFIGKCAFLLKPSVHFVADFVAGGKGAPPTAGGLQMLLSSLGRKKFSPRGLRFLTPRGAVSQLEQVPGDYPQEKAVRADSVCMHYSEDREEERVLRTVILVCVVLMHIVNLSVAADEIEGDMDKNQDQREVGLFLLLVGQVAFSIRAPRPSPVACQL